MYAVNSLLVLWSCINKFQLYIYKRLRDIFFADFAVSLLSTEVSSTIIKISSMPYNTVLLKCNVIL